MIKSRARGFWTLSDERAQGPRGYAEIELGHGSKARLVHPGANRRRRVGTEPGNYEVGAHQGEHSARAEIEIRKKEIIKDEPQEQWLRWRGVVPSQKWMQFYQKVISRFATTPGLKIEVSFEVKLDGEAGRAKAEEARQALNDLGLPANIEIVKGR